MRLMILLVTLLFTQTVFGYTVILKTGKMIEGRLIGEHPSTIQIRDQQGIVLSFKRDALDLEAMQQINKKPDEPRKGHLIIYWNPRPPAPEKSVVDLARELRSLRTGKARNVTDQDLTAAPELSVFGPAAYPETSETQPEQKPKDRTKEFDSFQRELYLLLKQKKKADASCARARQQMIYHQLKPSKEVRFITPFEEPAACIEARELQERIKKQELLLIELQV